LRILGSTRAPFAVKGGGHTFNPGFSSTSGIQIAMKRFSEIKVDPASATVEVGAGLTWDQVYAALESYGVSVIGGRVPGIGVAGLTLGGGECLLSSDVPTGYEMRYIVQVIPLRLANTALPSTISLGMSLSYQTELSQG